MSSPEGSNASSLLLDTHVFVWWAVGSDRLPTTVHRTIEQADRVFVSDVSLWEIVVKEATKHPMVGTADAQRWFVQAMSATTFDAVRIDARHIGAVQRLPMHHRDPFDRMLISQALTESLTMVSADAQFPTYPISVAWS